MAHHGVKTANKANNTEHRNSNYKTSDTEGKIKTERVAIDDERAGSKMKCVYFTRIIRFLTIFVVVLITTYVSLKVSKRFINNYVQTVVEHTDLHIGEIPFPAISICPLIGINWTKIPEMKIKLLGNNYSALFEAKFDRQIRKLIYAQQLDDFRNLSRIQENVALSEDDEYGWKSEGSNYTWSDIQKMLSYNCEKLFEKCVWQSVELPCCDIFRYTPIYGGYCFSFNMLHKKNESSLRTSFGVGPGNGLKVYIRNMEKDKFALVVHEPSTEPDIGATFLEAKRTIIVVNPIRFTSDPEIASLLPMLRRCYFTSEMRKKGITEGSCMRKCRLKYIRAKCNCTVATSPTSKSANEALKNTTQFCNLANVGCLNNLEDFIEYYASKNHYEEALYKSGLNCSCYHNCDYIKYNAALYLDPWGDELNANLSEFQIFYQQATFFSYRSVLVATWVDLLVSYGGIAGLFLGISAMSLIEYFKRSCGRWKRRIIGLYNYFKRIGLSLVH
ncbi:pickpocket protein 19 [Bactrocera tryoni]|uniref:pickpocket protein 19 n=1 Tax=Bactrocera tryoni TaxID=59916 RepID=UPI001A97AAD0|nr:pickpocket protein 19 [Bactrocera tryoni]